MTDRAVDRCDLTGVQYASDANLSARQAIYRFQQPLVRSAAWALDLVPLRGDERILDAGCGNGLHLGELERRGHRGPVCGLDLSAGMLPAARARSDAALLIGDAQHLPFAAASFDRVLAMHMLYHVPDRDLAVSELRLVLHRDGVALALTSRAHSSSPTSPRSSPTSRARARSRACRAAGTSSRKWRRARAVIERDGAFRIRTEVGCFVCR